MTVNGQPKLDTSLDFPLIAIAIGLVLLTVLLVLLGIVVAIFRPWLQAFLSGCPISVFQLIGMRLRKVNPNKIIPVAIAATQGGHPVGWADLERAYVQGIDIEKVTTAYVTARERGDNFTFEELVDAERESRLDSLLSR